MAMKKTFGGDSLSGMVPGRASGPSRSSGLMVTADHAVF
jgi:hypothetical protein